jgi:hypothetical protein
LKAYIVGFLMIGLSSNMSYNICEGTGYIKQLASPFYAAWGGDTMGHI